ncbi:MAG TPA: hypothetical protein VL854_06965 [Nitrososphaeraceae archaeon]|nr:hypothetical protein [Nitrososphaeraceae archaeon]
MYVIIQLNSDKFPKEYFETLDQAQRCFPPETKWVEFYKTPHQPHHWREAGFFGNNVIVVLEKA